MADPSEGKLYPGFEFPPEYAQSISKIISFWSALEYNVDLSIWHLAGVYPGVGACMTAQIYTLQGRLSALQALLTLRRADKKLIDRVNKYSERVRKPLEIRNRVVHDTWYQGVESKQVMQLEIGAKGSLTYGFKPIAVAELEKASDTVWRAMEEAAAIRDTIEAALPTLPEIPLKELHPTILRGRGHERTRSIGGTFVLYPPKPSSE